MTDQGSPCFIIGAGFGRTGTSSLQAALNQLGFGPAYHMREVFTVPGHSELWREAKRGKGDWQTIFKNYNSNTDFPGCCFYKELMEAFPNHKVILTVRDFDNWYKSTSETIYQVQFAFFGVLKFLHLSHRKMINEVIWDGVFDGKFCDKAYAKKKYDAHIEEVKKVVPADKLLVFSVKEGWGPLCDFLEVPVPTNEFPRLNDSEEFKGMISKAKTASYVTNGALLATIGGLVALGYYYFNKK